MPQIVAPPIELYLPYVEILLLIVLALAIIKKKPAAKHYFIGKIHHVFSLKVK